MATLPNLVGAASLPRVAQHSEANNMPLITVEGPAISTDSKRELVRRFTETAREVYQIEHITVVIKENPPENVGVNGQLLADRQRGA